MDYREDEGGPAGLAGLVRARRERAGLTQRELAVRAGLSVGAVRDIEQGRTAAPRPGSRAGLALALELGERELASPAGEPGGRRDRPRAAAADGLVLRVLGPVAAWRDGGRLPLGPVRQRAVLGLLALSQPAGLSRATILDAVWGEDLPAAAVGMLHGYVARLRRVLGPGRGGGSVLAWDGAAYRLEADDIRCDLVVFSELTARARRAAAAGDARRACFLYEQALGQWRGDPLGDLDLLAGHPAVTDLARRRVAVVIEYADTAGAAGIAGQAVDQLRALAARDPLDERVHARLMSALAAAGQQAAALSVYGDLRLRLDQELGVRPGPELAAAHLRVLRQETPAAHLPVLRQEIPATHLPVLRQEIPAAPVGGAGPGPVVPRQLPALGAHFTGRAAELAMLDSWLDQGPSAPGAVAISAISGTAGVGKTALAVCWAHRVAGRFPDGQLYLNLRGYGPDREPVPAAEATRAFLDALQVPAAQVPAGREAQAALYRSLLARRRMLIVLDNARDAGQVRPLLPGSPGCLVVVTSRDRLAGLAAAEGARPVTLDVLSHADARALLERRLAAERLGTGPVADELIGMCARLPLALSVAAARAAEHPGFPLRAIVAELRDERHRLDALETGDPVSGVRAVLSWSYESLTEPAARLFRLLGMHPGADLTWPAAASLAGVPLAAARRALGELARSSLLTEYAPGRFACHDLLRAYAAELGRARDSDAGRQAALHRALDYYLHTCAAVSRRLEPARQQISLPPAAAGVQVADVSSHAEALAWLEAEHQALLGAVARAAAAGLDRHAWQIPWALERAFFRRGWWHDLAVTQQTALAAATRLEDVAGQAHALCGLGRAHALVGSADESRACLSRALLLFRDLGDDATSAQAHVHMAGALAQQGRYRDAISHAEQARDLFAAAGHRNGQAGAVNNIGWYRILLGDHDQAVACARAAVHSFRELGDRHGEAIALDSLGTAYHHLGQHAQALACCQRALEVVRELGDRSAQAGILFNVGDAHHAAGHDDAARAAWTEALTTLDEQNPVQVGRLRARLSTLRRPGSTAY